MNATHCSGRTTQNGAFAPAESLLRETLVAAETSLHAQHPLVASVRRILSEAVRWQGRNDEAIGLAHEAVHAALNRPDVGIGELVPGQA